MALENGWSYEEVARQLHHHSGAFTAKQYAHTTDRRPPMEWAHLAEVPEVPERSQGPTTTHTVSKSPAEVVDSVVGLVSAEGLEPSTGGLRVRCSAN